MARLAALTKKAQAERTRAAIIDAAIALFARKGFASTSTQDLARAIGMTTGTLYWHFKDKEELLIAVLTELEQRLGQELYGEAEAVGGATAYQTLEAMIGRVARVVEKFQQNLLLVGVIGAEVTDTNPRVEKALRASYRRIAQVSEAVLRAGIEEGTVDPSLDVACAAQLLLGMYMGAILHQRLFREELPLSRALPVMRQMMVASVPTPTSVPSRTKKQRR